MNLLVTLPLLPLVAAIWLAFSSRAEQLGAGWVVALVAAFPVAVAVLAAPERFPFPELLVGADAALVLDHAARAALLLFGGLWLVVGLLLTRTHEVGPNPVALLVALSGATTLALAEGGALVFAGMLAVGYGLYAVMAGEEGEAWRRGARALVVLLVLSDLLVFEILLSAANQPAVGLSGGLLLLLILALGLRGGVPPAHAWLPPALVSVSSPTAILLAAVPTGAALFGAVKLFPDGAPEFGFLCAVVALAGAAWALLPGLLQTAARSTLGYAVAATAALLLASLPAGAGESQQLAWLGVALLGACAALPLVALMHAGWSRDIAVALALLVHGLAGGQAALHATAALSIWVAPLPALVAVTATLLLAVAARRTAAVARNDDSVEATRLAFNPLVIAVIGLGFAWRHELPGFGSLWPAPVGITLGLLAFRFLPRRSRPGLPPGDILPALERAIGLVLRLGRVVCFRVLPRLRDRLAARLIGLWDGRAWSRRVHDLDIKLRSWPATSLMMLLFAIGAALLMVR